MSGWPTAKLEDIADVIDSMHQTPQYSDVGYPMVRVTDIKRSGLNLFGTLKVSEDVFDRFSKNRIPKIGDIVFSRVGSYGNTSIVKTNEKFCLGQNTAFIVPKQDPYFLFYFLNSPAGDAEIESSVAGSTQPTVSLKSIRNFEIPMPPIEEQKSIATILSSLDDKIDLLHRQNKTLEAIAESLFKQWFVEGAGDWEEKPLSYFGEIICGKTPSKGDATNFNGDVPFIKIPDMHGNAFIFKTSDSLTAEGKESQPKKTLPAKSICVSCIATVGLVSMNVIESQTNQQINAIIPKHDYYRYFLYLFMKSSNDLLHALASGGTATLNLNTGNFSKIDLPFPGDDVFKGFNGVVEPLFNKIYANQLQVVSLEKLRDDLLPKLMSGEIRISDKGVMQ